MRRLFAAAVLALGAHPALACTLTSQMLTPGHWVDIADAPFDPSDPNSWLHVVVEAGAEPLSTVAWPNGAGGFAFVMPLSLDRPWQDVPVERVTLTDGAVGCEMTGATRAALTEAPGTMRRMIEAQVAAIAGTAVSLGADPAALDAATRDAPPVPGWGTALHAIAAPYAALPADADLTPEEREAQAVLDAYLAQTAAHARTGAKAEGFERLREVAPVAAPGGGLMKKGDLLMRPGERVRLAQASASAAPPPLDRLGMGRALSIDSAAHLSELMSLQFGATVANRPDVSIYRDTAGTLAGVGVVLGTALANPYIVESYTVLANSLFVEAMMNKLVEGLYPVGFRYADLLPGPFELNLKPPRNRGSLDRIMVIPRAKGVDVAKLVFDVTLNFVPFLKVTGGDTKAVASLARSVASGAKPVSAGVAAATATVPVRRATVVAGAMESGLKQALGTILGGKDVPDFVKLDPFEFPPVDIFGPGFSQVGRENSGAVAWGEPTARTMPFRARKPGVARMTISSWPGAFGTFSARTEQKVTVGSVALFVDPGNRIVMPGTVQDYTAFATGLGGGFDTVRLDPSPGFRSDEGLATRGAHDGRLVRKTRFEVEAPTDPALFPGELTFTVPDAPGVRQLRTLSLPTVMPRVSCMEPGAQVAFRALDEKDEPVFGAVWSEATGTGSISAAGVYTAPDERGGEARIVLRGVGGTAPVDEATVKIGCACEWSMSMRGQRFEGTGLTAFSFGAGGIATFVMMAIDGGDGGFTMTGEGTVERPTTLGAVLTVGDTVYASEPRMVTTLDPSCARPSVSIGSWGSPGPGWLSGSMSGTGFATEAFASAGCAVLHPYSIDFTVRTAGKDADLVEDIVARMRRGEVGGGGSTVGGAMLQGVAQSGMAGNLCLPEIEETP